MSESFYDSLLTDLEHTVEQSPIGQGFTKAVNAAEANVSNAVTAPLKALLANVGPLLVGIGFFLLGTLMIAFSAFDDLAQTAEKALGIASDPVGSAVGKGKPLLKKALTDFIP